MEIHKGDLFIESSRPIFCPEIIEVQGKINHISTFGDKFDKENIWLINLLKKDTRAITDYGYLYLKFLEMKGIIKINFIPDKIISTEVLSRLRRNLFTSARNGNKEVAFLLPYDKDSNIQLDNESKEFYRSN